MLSHSRELALLYEIRALQLLSLRTQSLNKDEIMSAIEDLQAAMTDLTNEAITDLETVIAKLAATPPDDTAAVQALTQQATDTVAKLRADMAGLTPPPAEPPVAPPNPDTP